MPVFEFEQRVDKFVSGEVTFILKNVQPYGFWTVSLDGGSTPKELDGHWTDIDLAKEAARSYAAKKKAQSEPQPKMVKVAGKHPKEQRYVEVEVASEE